MENVIWNTAQEMLETLVNGTIIVAIVALGLQARLLLKTRLTAERHQYVMDLAATIVTAIQQEYAHLDAAAKLALATKQLEEELAEAGIHLKLQEIRRDIESAVFAELKQWRIESVETLETLPAEE